MDRRSFFRLSALLGLPLAADAAWFTKKALRFQGKVVVVTGGTSGIGKEVVRAFAREGAKVFFCGRRQPLGKEVEALIRKEEKAEVTYFYADVGVEKDVKAFCEACAEKYGGIDIAFNNAGISQLPTPMHETSVELFDSMMRTHAYGTFFSMKYEIPFMLKRGKGRIVNNASFGANRVWSGQSCYDASKSAMLSLTRSGAVEYAKNNILVNTINPFCVRTPMIENRARYKKVPVEELAKFMPNPKLTEPEEVAQLVLFLSSDENTVLSGVELDLSLGYGVKG